MTVAHVYTVAFQGIEAREVDVQVHVGDGGGTGVFNIVGLADKAVAESKERVRAALSAIGLALPYQRITVNLAPADLPKEGSHYDLPIALGLLAAMGVLPASEMANYVALGELSLDAQVTAVAGVLPAALAASEQQRGLICPAACGPEAAWAGGVEIIATPSLIALVNHVKGVQVLNAPTPKLAEETPNAPDLRDVKGQETAKRALEIAAAGGHNMLMSLSYYRQCLDQLLPLVQNFVMSLEDIRGNHQLHNDANLMKSIDFTEQTINGTLANITGRLESFDKSTADMWRNLSAERFRKIEQLITSYHTTIGGVLCALSVKLNAWAYQFPTLASAGPVRRAAFIMSDMRQGIERISDIEETRPVLSELND